jgi:WAS/WASL-interacting protein
MTGPNGNGQDQDDDYDDYGGGGGGGVPEPPAVVGSWTFPMKGMFPPPRPFNNGPK